eukprot:6791774-Alexandrium_andersonii.AAC.1
MDRKRQAGRRAGARTRRPRRLKTTRAPRSSPAPGPALQREKPRCGGTRVRAGGSGAPRAD